jgi:hypothetical protein
VNVAYLKHCVLSFIVVEDFDKPDVSTRQRLLPVLAQLLDFAEEETALSTQVLGFENTYFLRVVFYVNVKAHNF